MKGVIFLDIDGVLTSARVHAAYGDKGFWKRFDPVAIEMFNRLAEAGADFVLSSTWRYLVGKNTLLQLHEAGFRGRFSPDWRTTSERTRYSRGQEIAQWLDRNKHIRNYLIVDDEIFDIKTSHPKSRIIQTNDANGFISIKDFKKALNIVKSWE